MEDMETEDLSSITFSVPLWLFEVVTLAIVLSGYSVEGTAYDLSSAWTSASLSTLVVQILFVLAAVFVSCLSLMSYRLTLLYGPFLLGRLSVITALCVEWHRSLKASLIFFRPGIVVGTLVYWILGIWLGVSWVFHLRYLRRKILEQEERVHQHKIKVHPPPQSGSPKRGPAQQQASRLSGEVLAAPVERETRHRRIHPSDRSSQQVSTHPSTHYRSRQSSYRLSQGYGAMSRLKATSRLMLSNVARVVSPAHSRQPKEITAINQQTGQKVIFTTAGSGSCSTASTNTEPVYSSCDSYYGQLGVSQRDSQRDQDCGHCRCCQRSSGGSAAGRPVSRGSRGSSSDPRRSPTEPRSFDFRFLDEAADYDEPLPRPPPRDYRSRRH